MSNEHVIDRHFDGRYLISPSVGHSTSDTIVYSLTDEEAEAVALANKILHDIGEKYRGSGTTKRALRFSYERIEDAFGKSGSAVSGAELAELCSRALPKGALVTAVEDEPEYRRYSVYYYL